MSYGIVTMHKQCVVGWSFVRASQALQKLLHLRPPHLSPPH